MKAKFGAIVVDGRGKLGGHVFSKNRAGAYMRTKVTPSNPQTQRQTLVRALFGAISQNWSGLTETQRDQWNEAVPSWAKTDIFGDLKLPSGKALFQRLNNQAQVVGLAPVLDVPEKSDLPTETLTDITVDVTAGTLTPSGAATAAGTQVAIFATAQLSAGTTFVKNRLRQIYTADAASYDASAAYTAYVAKYGVPAVGANVYAGLKYVLPTGQASPLQVISAPIV